MPYWLILRFEDGQQQNVASFPDVPPSPHDRDRRDAYGHAWARLADAVSSELSAGIHARVDQAHLTAANPHIVNAEATRNEGTVRVRCTLGCPERQIRFTLERYEN